MKFSRILPWLLGIAAILVLCFFPLILMVVQIWAPRFGIWTQNAMAQRTRHDYVASSMRTLATSLERYRIDHGKYFPGENYWGPFTWDMLQSVGAAPSEFMSFSLGSGSSVSTQFIDPYNLTPDKIEWRDDGILDADRGAFVRIYGSDYHYYTNGKNFWILISLGSDRVLSIPKETLDEVANEYQSEEEGYGAAALRFKPFTYDPTNGSISSGDIWRMKQ